MTTSSLIFKDTLLYLKKKLKRTTDDEVILQIIHKLSKIPVTMELLQDTGTGKVMRALAGKSGSIGSKASSLLNKWKAVVANSQKSGETSSLKEINHPKTMLHYASSKPHKSENKIKKYEKHYTEKHVIKDKHCKAKYQENSHTISVHSKDNHKEEKHSRKRLSNEELEHEFKKRHGKEKDLKIYNKDEYSEHCIKNNVENQFDKKNINKNELYSSKNKNNSSKRDSSSLQINIYNEDNDSIFPDTFFNNEQVFPSSNNFESIHNSIPFEPLRKKSRTCEFNSYKCNNELHTHSLAQNLDKDRECSSNFEKLPTKNLWKNGELSIKSGSSEKGKKHKTNEKSKIIKTVKKDFKTLSTEEFTSSEVTFEDCLSFNDIVPLKKISKPVPNLSKKVKGTFKRFKISSNLNDSKDNSFHSYPKYLEENYWKLPEKTTEKPASPEKCADISSTLSQTRPNYKPQRNYDYNSIKKLENKTDEYSLKFTSSRKERTAVYSGRKSKSLKSVPTLFECCTRVLLKNIDDIEYMGEIPYFLLESMLQRCTPSQLYRIEEFNPSLLEDTDVLWETHCKREFRTTKLEENETWRELYWRSQCEREERLKHVTANVSALIANSNPSRKAKLAFIDSVAKPPRDVARNQAKNRTVLPTRHTLKASFSSNALPRSTAICSDASFGYSQVEAKPSKPKVAPLMAKTLKTMKICFRR